MIRIGIGVIFSNRKFKFKGSINVYDYRFISFFFFLKNCFVIEIYVGEIFSTRSWDLRLDLRIRLFFFF